MAERRRGRARRWAGRTGAAAVVGAAEGRCALPRCARDQARRGDDGRPPADRRARPVERRARGGRLLARALARRAGGTGRAAQRRAARHRAPAGSAAPPGRRAVRHRGAGRCGGAEAVAPDVAPAGAHPPSDRRRGQGPPGADELAQHRHSPAGQPVRRQTRVARAADTPSTSPGEPTSVRRTTPEAAEPDAAEQTGDSSRPVTPEAAEQPATAEDLARHARSSRALGDRRQCADTPEAAEQPATRGQLRRRRPRHPRQRQSAQSPPDTPEAAEPAAVEESPPGEGDVH